MSNVALALRAWSLKTMRVTIPIFLRQSHITKNDSKSSQSFFLNRVINNLQFWVKMVRILHIAYLFRITFFKVDRILIVTNFSNNQQKLRFSIFQIGHDGLSFALSLLCCTNKTESQLGCSNDQKLSNSKYKIYTDVMHQIGYALPLYKLLSH